MKVKSWRAVAWCDYCNKHMYADRGTARAVARLHHGEHKSQYRCPDNPRYWHVGRLHPRVITGESSRSRAA